METALIALVSASVSVSIGLILPLMLYLDRQQRADRKEQHREVMAELRGLPIREFENRITVVEQASGQPPEQAWGRAQAQARASRQAAE